MKAENKYKLPERARRGGKKFPEFSTVTDQGKSINLKCINGVRHEKHEDSNSL
jgi:hypothetical protein